MAILAMRQHWVQLTVVYLGLPITDYFVFHRHGRAAASAMFDGTFWTQNFPLTVLGILGTVFYAVFIVPYQQYQNQQEQLRIFEDELAQKVEVRFDAGIQPYCHEWRDDDYGPQRLYRVGIYARRDLDNVVVKLESMMPLPPEVDYLPTPLRLMNSHHSVHQFDLRCTETRYVDIIQQTLRGNPEYLSLWHTVEWRNEYITAQDYQLKLVVYASAMAQPFVQNIAVRMIDGVCHFSLLP